MKTMSQILFALMFVVVARPAFAKREWKTYGCQNRYSLQQFGFAQVDQPSGKTNYYVAWDGKSFNLQVEAAIHDKGDGTIDLVAANLEKEFQAEANCARVR